MVARQDFGAGGDVDEFAIRAGVHRCDALMAAGGHEQIAAVEVGVGRGRGAAVTAHPMAEHLAARTQWGAEFDGAARCHRQRVVALTAVSCAAVDGCAGRAHQIDAQLVCRRGIAELKNAAIGRRVNAVAGVHGKRLHFGGAGQAAVHGRPACTFIAAGEHARAFRARVNPSIAIGGQRVDAGAGQATACCGPIEAAITAEIHRAHRRARIQQAVLARHQRQHRRQGRDIDEAPSRAAVGGFVDQSLFFGVVGVVAVRVANPAVHMIVGVKGKCVRCVKSEKTTPKVKRTAPRTGVCR